MEEAHRSVPLALSTSGLKDYGQWLGKGNAVVSGQKLLSYRFPLVMIRSFTPRSVRQIHEPRKEGV